MQGSSVSPDPLLSFQHNEALHRPHSLLLGAGSPQPVLSFLGEAYEGKADGGAMASLGL